MCQERGGRLVTASAASLLPLLLQLPAGAEGALSGVPWPLPAGMAVRGYQGLLATNGGKASPGFLALSTPRSGWKDGRIEMDGRTGKRAGGWVDGQRDRWTEGGSLSVWGFTEKPSVRGGRPESQVAGTPEEAVGVPSLGVCVQGPASPPYGGTMLLDGHAPRIPGDRPHTAPIFTGAQEAVSFRDQLPTRRAVPSLGKGTCGCPRPMKAWHPQHRGPGDPRMRGEMPSSPHAKMKSPCPPCPPS